MKLIKLILKKLFPIIFLKKLFLVYNGIKRKTWDKIFFNYYHTEPHAFKIFEAKNPFLELGIPIDHLASSIQKGLSPWLNEKWKDNQFLLEFNETGFIEPRSGWGVTKDNKLILHSLGLADADHVHKPSTFEVYIMKGETIRFDQIISLRDTGEENYFHFFNDVISKLFFLRDKCFDLAQFTIVVSSRVYEKDYFRIFLKNTWLQNLSWHVQHGEWISFNKAIFCKPFTHTKKYFCEGIDLIKPTSVSKATRKIFLIRDNRSLRYIENLDVIIPILNKYSLEIIDSAKLPFLEQIKIFSECSFLIGIHGAGLTNMIFREGKDLKVLEIVHPFEYVPFHYIMLAKQFGYTYNSLLGRQGKQQSLGGFIVDPIQLDGAISAMI